MKSRTWKRIASGALAFFVLCLIAYLLEPEPGEISGRIKEHITTPVHWYAIVPPVLTITLVFATNRLLISLLAGVLSGGILSVLTEKAVSASAFFEGVMTGLGYLPRQFEFSTNFSKFPAEFPQFTIVFNFNLSVIIFTGFILTMVTVMISAGGLKAVANWLSTYAEDRRTTSVITVVIGLLLFIDDYANTMIVGSTMRPLTDEKHISREKLAFLVDATAAPVAGIALISTWIGFEVGLFADQADKLGIARDGYDIFLESIGFRFYCFLMIGFVLVNVLSGRDFGLMKKAEKRANEEGKVLADDANPMTSSEESGTRPCSEADPNLLTAFVPLIGFFGYFLTAIWVNGGGGRYLRMEGGGWNLLQPTIWIDLIQEADHTILFLAIASMIGFFIACLCSIVLAGLTWKTMLRSAGKGIWASIFPLTILVLAWAVQEACNDVGTADFFLAVTGDQISAAYLPGMIFILAGITALTVGSSWGTMAVLIPIAAKLSFVLSGNTYGPLMMMTLAAVLDGAIFGDHCSPISDTTVLSSISSSCDHIHHVRTQIPYALTVATTALFFGYFPSALAGIPFYWGIMAGILLFVGIFYLLKFRTS